MPRLTSTIGLDQIDDWFRVGQQATAKPLKSVSSGILNGRYLDPKTKKAYIEPDVNQDPSVAKRRDAAAQSRKTYNELIRRSQMNAEEPDQASGTDGRGLTNQLDHLDLDSTAAADVCVVVPDNAVEVYNNYNFAVNYDPSLPITKMRKKILDTIRANQVTIIHGMTGSGKTTQVPQYILDECASDRVYCNIVVTQPRRIAAISIAKRVCSERAWTLGTVCGYQVGRDVKVSDDTRLLFCTSGVLREKLIARKSMTHFTHVILDEVHERNMDSDFGLLIAKKLLRTNSSKVKLILMSATMNSKLFSQYFGVSVQNRMLEPPTLEVEGQLFSVSVFYVDDLKCLGEVPEFDVTDPTLHSQIADIAVRLVEQLDSLEAAEQGVDIVIGFATVRGTVLAFLPGVFEIEYMMDKLRAIEQRCNLTVMALHSKVTTNDQARVFEKPRCGYRKVILSTNVAESSITVPDIKYVMDFCLTKSLVCDHETNFTHLMLEWASKSNCIQRKGRAGRVSKGRVYVMVPSAFYESCLQDHATPEMQRCSLSSLVLKTKMFEMGEPLVILSQAISPPNLSSIEKTVLNLKQVGALSLTCDGQPSSYNGDLTFIGRIMAELPVDIRVSKLMILGFVFGLLEECAIIGAALSLKSIFATPVRCKLEAFMHKYNWSDSCLSDCQTVLHAYKVWENNWHQQEFQRSGRNELQWGEQHFILTRRINEVKELVSELLGRLSQFNLKAVRAHVDDPRLSCDGLCHQEPGVLSAEDTVFLKIVICGAFYPNYFCTISDDETQATRALSGLDPLNTVMVRGLPQNQGVLYRNRIIKLFSVCCKPGTRPTVDFEETRAYVKFPPMQQSKRVVNPAVCFALKLRQLRIPLTAQVYNKETQQVVMNLMDEACERLAGQGLLRTSRVSGDAEEQPSSGSCLPVVLPDPSRSVMEVTVTHVIECGHFYVNRIDQDNIGVFSLLHHILDSPTKELTRLTRRACPNVLCAAPFYEVLTEKYYRACIEDVALGEYVDKGVRKTAPMASVFFVDYGNRERVPVSKLRDLPPAAAVVPQQALECELTDICPSSIQCPNGRWTPATNLKFSQMVSNRRFMAQVYSVVRGCVRVRLVPCDAGLSPVSINSQLVMEKLAMAAEESYQSKQDHQWREMMAKKDPAKRGNPSAGHRHVLNIAFEGQARDLPRGQTFSLIGPSHPCEMGYRGMTLASSARRVQMESDSVNSVAINTSPQYKFQRLMVSACTSQKPDGRTLIARDTTIMPEIPGFPAIMCLLFAPCAELRVSKDKRQYTGALCGLGYDHSVGNGALLPDADMEIEFDTRIDDEDIQLINCVRDAIDLALGTEESTAQWAPTALAQRVQKPAKEKLLMLLNRKRTYVEPRYIMKANKWNQLSKSEVVSNNDLNDRHRLAILRRHDTVRLVADHSLSSNSKRRHIEELHQISESSDMTGPVSCRLCRQEFTTAQLLSVHLQTASHQRQERFALQQGDNGHDH